MGKKRNTVVVLSSDDDDGEEEGVRSLSSSRRPWTRSRLSSTVPREKPRRSKKARRSGSSSGLCQKSGDWDEVISVFVCVAWFNELIGFGNEKEENYGVLVLKMES